MYKPSGRARRRKPTKYQHRAAVAAAFHADVAPNCHYCGEEMLWDYNRNWIKMKAWCVQVDHIIPQALGGDESEANMVLCCSRCNSIKGDRLTYAEMVERRMAQ